MRHLLRPLALPVAILAAGLGVVVMTRAAAGGAQAHDRPLVARSVVPAQTAAHPTATRPTSATPTPTPRPDPPATPAPPQTTVHTMLVGTTQRQWEQITPGTGLDAGAPIVMVLHGQAVLANDEVGRDGLGPLVEQSRAELVYPQGIDRSWNVGGCCGGAGDLGIDDLDFLRDLVDQVDPGHAHPIHLIGYSNGGRLAYSLACNAPVLFDAYAVVAAMPMPSCVVSRPIDILQVAGTTDPAIAYLPGQSGFPETPAATVQVQRLRTLDGCTAAPARETHGRLTLETWSGCGTGTRVALATYSGQDHGWPVGDATTPAAGPVIWQFLTGQPW